MRKCPLCSGTMTNGICHGCGYDMSCDYESYLTLCKISDAQKSLAERKRALKATHSNYLSCPNCGGDAFSITLETKSVICLRCNHVSRQELLLSESAESDTTTSNDERLRNIVFSNTSSSQEDRDAIFEAGRKKLMNNDEGFRYVQYAAKKGSRNGAILLGYCYDIGLGVKQDKKVAEAYYRQGAMSNPEFERFFRQKDGAGSSLLEAAAKAAEKMLTATYKPVQTAVSEKKTEIFQQTATNSSKTINSETVNSEQDEDNALWAIVNENRKPTKEESIAIFNLGRKLLKSGNTVAGIKLIGFTSQYGNAYGALLLGYCYDRGIGVPKDYHVATAYYTRAGASGEADDSFKLHGWNDFSHRSRAYSVAERIYNGRI